MAPVSAIFVDVDTGIDDALALIYLLASDADLVGIASTGGNIAVEQVCANNLGLLDLCRAAAIPVSHGADRPLNGERPRRGDFHGPNGVGYAELARSDRRLTEHDAATAWVRAARAHPGELVGLATAPLTNLALALRMEPALPSLVQRLVIMGGVFDGQGPPEWNIGVDADAAAEVFAAWAGQPRLPVVCGLDLTRKVVMTPPMLDGLPAASPVIRFIREAMRFYFEVYRDRGLGYLAHLHDPLAAAVALDPQLVVTRTATVHVEVAGNPGMTSADWNGAGKPNAQIGIDVDSEAFFARFMYRVGEFANRLR
ncbi:nucleoside hydrolase [Mycobacterium sp. TY814]|uniref:nucleoside hydrolase n=1 Tax=Mycobacterium sp. TY814 TaxID=3050580 RepID=UPI0027407EAD|nr:nucleoside hydrolase [Mycobacterium sp. TY814]MDP7722205.1 nucleoside hydrolase [Mycobacterium sp. TY814]